MNHAVALFFNLLTIAATSAALLLGISVLLASIGTQRHPGRYRNIIFSLLIFSLGYLNFYLFAVDKRLILEFPHLLFTNVLFAVNIGPLCYLYIRMILSEERTFRPKDLLCFVPSALVTAFLLPYLFLSARQKIALNSDFTGGRGLFTLRIFIIVSILNMAAFLAFSFYRFIIRTNRIAFIFRKFKSNMLLIIAVIAVVCIFLMNGIFSFFGMLSGNILGIAFYNFIFSLIILAIFFLNQRFLYLFVYGTLHPGARSKDLLEKIDKESLRGQLTVMMKERKLYLDEDLSLSALARILDITPHQLSQYLNEEHKLNFNNFVNRFRIDEAKRMMNEDADAQILSIAFTVGFNSYSTFAAAFKKQTGVSAGKYRTR